ncbi:MAG: SDR family oxidoreductase [Polyangiales bacterium]
MADSKRILITGSSSGFGFGAAKALAARGHRVFASMRGAAGKNAAQADALRSWAKTEGKTLEVLELDVTDEDSVGRAVAAMVAQVGGVDTLINNAGVGTWGPQEAFTPEQVQRMFDVNVFGVLRLNRAVLPHMRAAGRGHLIYVSSGLGRIQLPFIGPYTASKHAIEALAETASYELAPLGIDTSILQPGAYGTSFLANSLPPADSARVEAQPKIKAMFEAFGSGFEAKAKAGELGNPEEIVDALVALVEAAAGQRPLRQTVGDDVKEGVGAINATCAQVQARLLSAFGLR